MLEIVCFHHMIVGRAMESSLQIADGYIKRQNNSIKLFACSSIIINDICSVYTQA